MTAKNLHVLWSIVAGAGYAFAVPAAILGAWASIQTKVEQSQIQDWLGAKWRSIEASSWSSLPEKSIHLLQRGRARLETFDFNLTSVWAGLLSPFLLSAGLATRAADAHQAFFQVWLLPLLTCSGGYSLMWWLWNMEGRLLWGWTVTALTFLATILWLKLTLASPARLSFLISLIMSPMLAYCVVYILLLTQGRAAVIRWGLGTKQLNVAVTKIQRHGGFLGLSIALSFSITFLAIWIGEAMESTTSVPQTAQLLFSNAIFDGLTIVATLSILGRAGKFSRWFSIPAALSVGVLLAAFFALMSLRLGLLNTPDSLTFRQEARIMVAHSPYSFRWEFGPLFWIMHTTFLPTFLYLSIVWFCWLAKATIVPTRWFLGKAQHPDINPLGMTSRLLAVPGVFFGLCAYALSFWK